MDDSTTKPAESSVSDKSVPQPSSSSSSTAAVPAVIFGALCLIGLVGFIVAAMVIVALIPVYLPAHGGNVTTEFSEEQSIVYNLPENIELDDGPLTDAQLTNFQTAMQQNLATDGETRGSLIILKNGTIYTTSRQRKRRAQVILISEEGHSSLSTTKYCKLAYVLKFSRRNLLKVPRMQLLRYIKETVLIGLELSGFDLYPPTPIITVPTLVTLSTSVSTASTAQATTIPNNCIPNMSTDRLSLATVSLASPNDEYVFNEADTPITLQLSCPILNTSSYVLFSSNDKAPIANTTSTNASITIPAGFPPGITLLTLIALDTYGLPLFFSFSLYFGNILMPVQVLYKNGTAAVNVFVQMNLTDFTRVSESAITNSNGTAFFTNVPPVTVSIFAHTADNQIGLGGTQPTSYGVTINLIPFESSGKKRRRRRDDEGTPFTVFTNYVEALQTQSASFMSKQDATEVYVEYQFITAEVPGGFFGSQYNDYFSVTIRSDTGDYRTITQSMNSLGLGAFDYASGAAAKTNLTMPVGKEPESIQIDIGVQNVADALLQSQLTVDRYGSDGCEECEMNCDKCKSDPICSPSCMNPPLKSCDFYLSCLEKKVPCGPSGYALNYGIVYCTKFVYNIDLFSSEGQTWVYSTMNCLQKALVSPLENCVKDCSTLQDLAFSSHPSCYVNNGVCELPVLDYLVLLPIVGPGLLSSAGIIQVIYTTPQCIPSIVLRIEVAEVGVPDFLTRQALLILRKWLLCLSS